MSKVGGGACDAKVRYPRSAGAIDAHVGSRMRLRRLQLGLTQVDLAQILCVTFQQVQKYEKGVNRMGATRLFHLGMALGVPVQYFFDDIRDEEIDQSQASGFSKIACRRSRNKVPLQSRGR